MSVPLPSSLARPWPRRQDFRQRSNYYLAALTEIGRLPLQIAGRALSRNVPPSPPQSWRNGLLLGACHIGDVLYNTASLPALRAGLPNCSWTYLVSGVTAQILEGNPNIDRVVSAPGSRFPARLQDASAPLAGEKFDVAVAYNSGTCMDLLVALKLGIPNRVGYSYKGFSGLVTHPVSLHFPQPYPAYFRDLVGQLTGLPADWPLRPLVYLQPKHEQAADEAAATIGLDWKKPVLACSVTSRQPTGIWAESRFLETIQHVRRQVDCHILYTGAKSDAAQLAGLVERTGPGAFSVAGALDLLGMVALLRRCRAALTPDSGSRHLANAAGIPVVFLRNLFNRKIETGAYCDTDHDMVPDGIELIPTAEQGPVFDSIEPERVAAEVVSLLRG